MITVAHSVYKETILRKSNESKPLNKSRLGTR